jgi:hypothetical protein
MPVGVAAYPQKSLSEDDENKSQHQPMRTVHQTYKHFTGALSAGKKKLTISKTKNPAFALFSKAKPYTINFCC